MTTKRPDIMIDEETKNLEEDMKEEFEASPKILLEIEQFSDKQMEHIAKDIGELLEGYWAALRETVEKELCKRWT